MWDQTEIRQGDRLPTFAGVILDDQGNPVILDPAIHDVTITLIGQRTGHTHIVPAQIAVAIPGAVTYDWQDTTLLDVDTYDVIVNVVETGTNIPMFAAPTRRTSVVVIRPPVIGLRSNGMVWDDDIYEPVWDDPQPTVWI